MADFEDDSINMNTDDEHMEAILSDLMQIKGVGKTQAEKLYNAQLYSIEQIASMPIPALMERTGFNKAAAQKLIDNAKPLCDLGGILSGTEVFHTEEGRKFLRTGSRAIDELIGGGYPVGLISEIHAENGMGKSQSCFTASVMATLPESEGGLDGHVIYIDTEGTFDAHRIAQIAEARGYDPQEVLSRVHVARVMTSSQQVLIMDKVNELATQIPIRLVIVDSIMARFRTDFAGGRQNLPERQGMMGQHLSDLLSFATRNKAVILVTNQVSAVPDANPLFGPTVMACGGHVLGHACAVRMMIRRGKAGTRIIKLIKSNCMPVGEAPCTLDIRGIGDKE